MHEIRITYNLQWYEAPKACPKLHTSQYITTEEHKTKNIRSDKNDKTGLTTLFSLWSSQMK